MYGSIKWIAIKVCTVISFLPSSSTKRYDVIEQYIFCPRDYQSIGPICGTDGVTYTTMCELEFARIFNRFLDIRVLEKCEPTNLCDLNWDPVCGTDMVTYSNLCAFTQAHDTIPGLKILHKGECMMLVPRRAIRTIRLRSTINTPLYLQRDNARNPIYKYLSYRRRHARNEFDL